MKKLIPLFLVVCLFRPGAFAAEAPATPPPDQAATAALKSLEDMISRGEVGWWKSQADPGIQFLNKYSNLGSDTVSALTLNHAEDLWPAWKTVGPGLEKFGIACSVYNCLKSASEGNYNAAVLNALKDFVKYRLSKMGDNLAASAAGVGLIDFALTSFGEAAMQQIADDYWEIYCSYQNRNHPSLADYVRLIKQGGFTAVTDSLDSFWDDPATHGIRGFENLKTQDKNYKATFRTRFLKENVLPFLQTWAEHEQEKAQIAAWIQLRNLTEQLQNTRIAVDFALLEKGLNEPPAGATVDLVARFYNSGKTENRVLAQAPIAARNRLEFLLGSAFSSDREHQLPRSLFIRLHRAGVTEEPTSSGSNVFELSLIDASGPWRREAKPGQLAYIAKQPIYTTAWSEFPITLTGPGADKIYSLTFLRVPVGTATTLRELAASPGGGSVSMKDGQGKTRLEHGLYLATCENEDNVFTYGPVKIAGPMPLTIPVSPATVRPPATPDPARLHEQVAQAAAAVRSRQESQRDAIAAASKVLQDYWLATYNALNAYTSTARALRKKMNEELAQPKLTPAQSTAITQKYQPRAAEMEKARYDAERAMYAGVQTEEKVVGDLDRENNQRYDALRKQYSAVSDEMNRALNDVRQKLWPLSSDFEKIANKVTGGSLLYMAGASLDQELAQMRQALANIETNLPALLAAYDKLPGLLERYNQVAAAIREVEANEGTILYSNPSSYDDEVAMLGLKVDAIRNSGYLDQARALMQKAERIVEQRRENARRAAEFLQDMESLAQQLPAVDEGLWRTRTAAFRERADPLFAAALAPEGADDTAAFRSLQKDLSAFFKEQAAICGDQLDAPDKTETAFSRFNDKYLDFNRQQLSREAPQDFWQKMEQIAWSKIRARANATREAVTLAKDVATWLKTGATRTTRAQQLVKLRADLDPKTARDTAGQIEQLNRLDAAMQLLPARLVQTERQAWQTARTQLVRSGQLEAWLRGQNRPYVDFATFNDKPADQAYFWPEKAARENPQTQQGLSATLALKNVPDDSFCRMQVSRDGGKTWQNILYQRGKWPTFLQWQGTDLRFRALLPNGTQTIDLPAFPQFVSPEKS
ncbi:MAG TPA: hypothetical protein VMC06_05285 [Opitutaceae bacterium]|nr:hypothetical protein [Opitutaceae bacterium]